MNDVYNDPDFNLWEYFIGTDLPRIANCLTFFLLPIGIGACIMCISQSGSSLYPKSIRRFFISVSSATIVYLFSHFSRIVLLNFNWSCLTVILPVLTFMEYLSSGLIVFIISLFILNDSGAGKSRIPCLITLSVLLGINTVLLIISQFTGMYYSYPVFEIAEGIIYTNYVQGDYYFISNIAPGAMMLLDAVLLVVYRKNFNKKLLFALWVYIAVPVAAMIIKTIFPDYPFIMWATVIADTFLLISILRTKSEEYEKQNMEATRLDTELTTATRIQADMLPSDFPAFPDRKEFDIYASMDPAKEVGGDFYDFFLVDDDHLGMVMADVSGKGVPAALFMMSSKILLKNYALMTKDPKAALEKTNYQICQNNREGMFVTVWLGILDLKTGVLTAANAGHEQPALKEPDGSFELIKDKHGLMVGYMDKVKYRTYELTMKKGSKLFLYTDGVAEATNAKEELFGTKRMIEALRKAENGTPKEILAGVRRAVDGFVEDAPQFDDLTMLCVEYFGKDEG